MSKRDQIRKRRSTFESGVDLRNYFTRVKTAKGRKSSSANWLRRQLNDPYVKAAKRDGYRSRAAYKLLQLDKRFQILRPGMKVVELGAAPGGWSQVISKEIRSYRSNSSAKLIAVDTIKMDPLLGVKFFQRDFMSKEALIDIKNALSGHADAVLCDISPTLIGHRKTDHLRLINIVEVAFTFACDILSPNGCFVAKVFQGGTENALLSNLKKKFRNVKHAKPPASRTESSELYVVAQGFHLINRKHSEF